MKTLSTLMFVVLSIGASAAVADEGVPCTLARGLKVMNKGQPTSLPAGKSIVVVKKDATWSDVLVDGQPRKAPTAALTSACPEPPPAPVEPAPVETPPAPVEPPPPPTPEPTPESTTQPTQPMTLAPTTPPTAPPTKARPLRVAVKPLVAAAADERLAGLVSDATAAELRKLQRTSVVSFDEIQAMLDLEAEKQLAGCSDDSCIAEIAEALGVDVLIIGSIARLEGEKTMVLKRIDQRAGTVQSAEKRLADLGGEECLAAVGPMVEELFPDVPLRDGRTRGVSDEIELRLHPPPIPAWVTLGGFIVAGVGVVGAATSGVITATLYQQAQTQKPSSTEEYQQLNAPYLMAQGTLIGSSAVAVVVGGTSAVAVFFTDWKGEAE